MAYYNRRDILAHWVTRQQAANRACTHACCRGYRIHPKGEALVLPSRRLHGATDDQLADYFNRVAYKNTPQSQRAEKQVLHEMDRRDRMARHRQERAAAVQANRAARRMERDAETHRIRLEAEDQTKGYLVNAEGRDRGISDTEILTGRDAVFIRYATGDAKAYFADHPRPTPAYFRGEDTRMPYSDYSRPERRRPAGYRARSSRRGPVTEYATVRRAAAS
jgi:hypothetical protein